MTPLDPRTTANIVRTVHDSVVANVNGVFAVILGQGLLLSLGFWFVGVRSPVLWGSLVVGSADNVLRAFVVGAREKQHPMLIGLAAIGGMYAFGAVGILLGPLVLSLAAALLKDIQQLVSPSAVANDRAQPPLSTVSGRQTSRKE